MTDRIYLIGQALVALGGHKAVEARGIPWLVEHAQLLADLVLQAEAPKKPDEAPASRGAAPSPGALAVCRLCGTTCQDEPCLDGSPDSHEPVAASASPADDPDEPLVICGCGRPFYRSETITDECESCYELRRGL